MGCWCSVVEETEHYNEEYGGFRTSYDTHNQRRLSSNPLLHNMHHQYYRANNYYQCVTSLAMAMYRAEQTAAAVAGYPNFSLSAQCTDFLVRKAKADGSTVKVIEDRLYIDYKYVGRVPKDVNIRN